MKYVWSILGKNINKVGNLRISLIANLLSFIITSSISFFLTPFLVNNLGKEIYGFYGIANSFVNFITVISISLNSMAAKYITVELAKKNIYIARKYFTSIFYSNVLLCLVLTPIVIIIIIFLDSIITISNTFLSDVQILFAFIFASMLLRFVTSIFGSVTYVKNRTDLNAYVNIIRSILKLLLYGLIFIILKPSVVYLGVIIFLVELYNSIVQMILCSRMLPNIRIERNFFDFKLVWNLMKVGVWNSVNQIGDLLLSSSDLYLANILIGEIASGNISIVSTVPILISGIISSVNTVFVPRIALAYAKDSKKLLLNEVVNAQKIMGGIVTPIVIMLIIFRRDFYDLWIPGNDTVLISNLSILHVLRMAVIGVVWPIINLNIVTDRVKIPSLFVLLSGIVNILLTYILIRHTSLGIYSIIITTFILTILIYGIFVPLYSSSYLKVNLLILYKPVFKMIICSVIIYAVFSTLYTYVNIYSWADFFLYGILFGGVSLVISYMVFFKII